MAVPFFTPRFQLPPLVGVRKYHQGQSRLSNSGLLQNLWTIQIYLDDSPVFGSRLWHPFVGESPPKNLKIGGVQFRPSLMASNRCNFLMEIILKLSKQRDSTDFFAIRFSKDLISVFLLGTRISPSFLPPLSRDSFVSVSSSTIIYV